MKYNLIVLKVFSEQVKKLDSKTRLLIHEKIQLIKENPYRYKKIHSKKYSKVFRVRISIKSKESRLIYTIIEPNVILVCLLDRKKDYKDLEKYLNKIKNK